MQGTENKVSTAQWAGVTTCFSWKAAGEAAGHGSSSSLWTVVQGPADSNKRLSHSRKRGNSLPEELLIAQESTVFAAPETTLSPVAVAAYVKARYVPGCCAFVHPLSSFPPSHG